MRVMPRITGSISMITGARISLLFLCLHLAWPFTAWASEGMDTVMGLLARVSLSESSYLEEKHYDMLDIPMVRSGQLSYRAPDFLSWVQGQNGQLRFEIHGNEMIAYRGNSVHQRMPLDSVSAASAFVESFRATLAGDARRLSEHYYIAFSGQPDSWQLSLKPRHDDIGRFIEHIRISGESDRIHEIRIEESNGDWSLMRLESLRQEYHAG
jgi:hypothetical protein